MGVVSYLTVDGEILSETRSGVERDYLPDSLGSTVVLLDSGQNLTDTFAYWPYGEEQSRTGTTGAPFQYVGTFGYHLDSGSVTYVRARAYLTQLARWFTTDPIWPREHAFEYCGSHPTSVADPTGYTDWWPAWMSDGGGDSRNYQDFMKCALDAARTLTACAHKNPVHLQHQIRCIAGCETDDPTHGVTYNPFITDDGSREPSDQQGIGPCRLTTQNRYPVHGWEANYCANAMGGVWLLCTRGLSPWTGTTPGCYRRCMQAKYPSG